MTAHICQEHEARSNWAKRVPEWREGHTMASKRQPIYSFRPSHHEWWPPSGRHFGADPRLLRQEMIWQKWVWMPSIIYDPHAQTCVIVSRPPSKHSSTHIVSGQSNGIFVRRRVFRWILGISEMVWDDPIVQSEHGFQDGQHLFYCLSCSC